MRRLKYEDSRGLNARSALYARYRRPEDDFKRWVFKHLEMPPDARILDMGCGPGAIWSENAERIPEEWSLTLLDVSPGMLADAGSAHDRVLADAQSLPFRDGSFDAATAFHMLYDLPDAEAGIAEVRRVVRPGGAFHATTNGAGHLIEFHDLIAEMGVRRSHGIWHLQFGPEEGADLLRRHFDDVRLFSLTTRLEVTEVRPLVDYALSVEEIREQLEARQDEDRWRAVSAAIETDGSFPLTTEGVLLVAR